MKKRTVKHSSKKRKKSLSHRTLRKIRGGHWLGDLENEIDKTIHPVHRF